MIVGSAMTDHPSWIRGEAGGMARAARMGPSVWVLTCEPVDDGWRMSAEPRSQGAPADDPRLDVFDPSQLDGPSDLIDPLRLVGTVGRWRNPDLWDAMATSIVRQVIRAGQARKLYRQFCLAHGDQVETPYGSTALFPTPETVLALPDVEYQRLGLAFKRRPLQAAAEAVIEFGAKWAELEPNELRHEVQSVPRIGPWTAGATVADLSNDYALYPYADLAVRTWAKRLAPGRTWPDAEAEFGQMWARLARERLSEWTLLTLAWGVRHATTTGGTAL